MEFEASMAEDRAARTRNQDKIPGSCEDRSMAGRPPLYEEAMTAAQRREKNDADKRARGEVRKTFWLTREGARALEALKAGDTSWGAISNAINGALIKAAPPATKKAPAKKVAAKKPKAK